MGAANSLFAKTDTEKDYCAVFRKKIIPKKDIRISNFFVDNQYYYPVIALQKNEEFVLGHDNFDDKEGSLCTRYMSHLEEKLSMKTEGLVEDFTDYVTKQKLPTAKDYDQQKPGRYRLFSILRVDSTNQFVVIWTAVDCPKVADWPTVQQAAEDKGKKVDNYFKKFTSFGLAQRRMQLYAESVMPYTTLEAFGFRTRDDIRRLRARFEREDFTDSRMGRLLPSKERAKRYGTSAALGTAGLLSAGATAFALRKLKQTVDNLRNAEKDQLKRIAEWQDESGKWIVDLSVIENVLPPVDDQEVDAKNLVVLLKSKISNFRQQPMSEVPSSDMTVPDSENDSSLDDDNSAL